MKVELNLRDSRVERPDRSCEVVVFFALKTPRGEVCYSMYITNYSKVYDRFLCCDDWEDDEVRHLTNDYMVFWCYMDEIKECELLPINHLISKPLLRIKPNPNKKIFNEVTKAVNNNNGYCPCELTQTEDTKCICKAFREQNTVGECHCGRYIKEEYNED